MKPARLPIALAAWVVVVTLWSLLGTHDHFNWFLEAVPDNCDHLLINGDLFEFWFTYQSVIPREVTPNRLHS